MNIAITNIAPSEEGDLFGADRWYLGCSVSKHSNQHLIPIFCCFPLSFAWHTLKKIQLNDIIFPGWMAEHMLIMGITREKEGKEHFITAAFPSACGKTNMAMLEPAIPGYRVRVVGDDIAWMRFNSQGQLVAINPEAGFFGWSICVYTLNIGVIA
jgi:hypothetical protein